MVYMYYVSSGTLNPTHSLPLIFFNGRETNLAHLSNLYEILWLSDEKISVVIITDSSLVAEKIYFDTSAICQSINVLILNMDVNDILQYFRDNCPYFRSQHYISFTL